MTDTQYDVAVVGGGIVGCAMIFELAQKGFSCILLEKNLNIMSEASAGNSGMLHTGFDAPLLSLEQQCIKLSQTLIFDIIDKFNIPFRKCGALLVAWTEKQNEKISSVIQNAHTAGVEDVFPLSLQDLYKKEPYLRRDAVGALCVPDESVIDSSLLGLCFAHHAKMQGAKIITNCEVFGFKDHTLSTAQGNIKARVTINCAGLYGDRVDDLAGIHTFSIKPRKGQYCLFSKNASHLLSSIIFPVPTEKTKGTALFNSVYNNIIMGPTAEDVEDRTRPDCDPKIHHSLTQNAHHMISELSNFSPIGQYVGVRPATQYKEYQIRTYPQIGWISVGGIRSTGVSASIGIARHVGERLVQDMGLDFSHGRSRKLEDMTWEQGDDGASVIIEGCRYQTTHPLCLYGQQNYCSRL